MYMTRQLKLSEFFIVNNSFNLNLRIKFYS